MEKILEMATHHAEEAELYRVRSQTKEVGFKPINLSRLSQPLRMELGCG